MPLHIGHDLDETTQLYIDVHIAVDCLHMRYPDYIRQTSVVERRLYQLYLALKGQKDKHAQWHAEHDSAAKQIAERAIRPDTTRE